ncbi:MAG: DUF2062 domain-containing protein [Deltaproteobacteria bacterium]|nr:DUF2062 domain-containing protein [Deltaproteobacteria bacterium]
MFRRLWEKIKLLWKLAKSERASPREIAWAVAIGAFAGCTPAVGVHGPLALGLATLFKKNRLFAWLGSRVSNMVFLPFIALAEVQVAHRVRTGAWLDIDRHNAIDRAGELLLDWCLGTIPVGLAIAALTGMMAWGLAHRRDRRRAREAKEALEGPPTPPPAALPPPSSESPS